MLFFLTKSSAFLACASVDKKGGDNFFGEDRGGEWDNFGGEDMELDRDKRVVWDLNDRDSSLLNSDSISSFTSILPDLERHGIGEGRTTLFSFNFSTKVS